MSLAEFGVEVKSASFDQSHPWWQPLISLVNFIMLGYFIKTYFAWDSQKISRFRRLVFSFLLPFYVFRNMWVAQVDSSMYDIAKVSFIIHVFQALFWGFLYANVRDRCMRGWLTMISQGCLTSFFYTNLGVHPAFGQQAVAVCLLFDIGGNTPCAQGLLWGLAAFFSPNIKKESDELNFESAFSNPLLDSGRNFLQRESDKLNVFGNPLKEFKSSDLDSPDFDSLERQNLLADRPEGEPPRALSLFESAIAVLYQPILPAFALGITLSLYNVGCPVSLDYAMESIGLFFKPCLYILIGLCFEIISSPLQIRFIATALSVRYLFAGLTASIMWLWLPFGAVERTTMALAMLSPVSTMPMYLTAEYNYPKQYVSMSATLTSISVLFSFFIQEAVMRSF